MRDPLSYYRNNTANSRALIECVVNSGVRHFIFSSTAAVYGNPGEDPVKEDTPTVPISPYGWSKLMTEIMLRDAGSAYDLHHVILRYFNVAGADPHGRAGQSSKDVDTFDQDRGRDGGRLASQDRRLRHRLSDA